MIEFRMSHDAGEPLNNALLRRSVLPLQPLDLQNHTAFIRGMKLDHMRAFDVISKTMLLEITNLFKQHRNTWSNETEWTNMRHNFLVALESVTYPLNKFILSLKDEHSKAIDFLHHFLNVVQSNPSPETLSGIHVTADHAKSMFKLINEYDEFQREILLSNPVPEDTEMEIIRDSQVRKESMERFISAIEEYENTVIPANITPDSSNHNINSFDISRNVNHGTPGLSIPSLHVWHRDFESLIASMERLVSLSEKKESAANIAEEKLRVMHKTYLQELMFLWARLRSLGDNIDIQFFSRLKAEGGVGENFELEQQRAVYMKDINLLQSQSEALKKEVTARDSKISQLEKELEALKANGIKSQNGNSLPDWNSFFQKVDQRISTEAQQVIRRNHTELDGAIKAMDLASQQFQSAIDKSLSPSAINKDALGRMIQSSSIMSTSASTQAAFLSAEVNKLTSQLEGALESQKSVKLIIDNIKNENLALRKKLTEVPGGSAILNSVDKLSSADEAIAGVGYRMKLFDLIQQGIDKQEAMLNLKLTSTKTNLQNGAIALKKNADDASKDSKKSNAAYNSGVMNNNSIDNNSASDTNLLISDKLGTKEDPVISDDFLKKIKSMETDNASYMKRIKELELLIESLMKLCADNGVDMSSIPQFILNGLGSLKDRFNFLIKDAIANKQKLQSSNTNDISSKADNLKDKKTTKSHREGRAISPTSPLSGRAQNDRLKNDKLHNLNGVLNPSNNNIRNSSSDLNGDIKDKNVFSSSNSPLKSPTSNHAHRASITSPRGSDIGMKSPSNSFGRRNSSMMADHPKGPPVWYTPKDISNKTAEELLDMRVQALKKLNIIDRLKDTHVFHLSSAQNILSKKGHSQLSSYKDRSHFLSQLAELSLVRRLQRRISSSNATFSQSIEVSARSLLAIYLWWWRQVCSKSRMESDVALEPTPAQVKLLKESEKLMVNLRSVEVPSDWDEKDRTFTGLVKQQKLTAPVYLNLGSLEALKKMGGKILDVDLDDEDIEDAFNETQKQANEMVPSAAIISRNNIAFDFNGYSMQNDYNYDNSGIPMLDIDSINDLDSTDESSNIIDPTEDWRKCEKCKCWRNDKVEQDQTTFKFINSGQKEPIGNIDKSHLTGIGLPFSHESSIQSDIRACENFMRVQSEKITELNERYKSFTKDDLHLDDEQISVLTNLIDNRKDVVKQLMQELMILRKALLLSLSNSQVDSTLSSLLRPLILSSANPRLSPQSLINLINSQQQIYSSQTAPNTMRTANSASDIPIITNASPPPQETIGFQIHNSLGQRHNGSSSSPNLNNNKLPSGYSTNTTSFEPRHLLHSPRKPSPRDNNFLLVQQATAPPLNASSTANSSIHAQNEVSKSINTLNVVNETFSSRFSSHTPNHFITSNSASFNNVNSPNQTEGFNDKTHLPPSFVYPQFSDQQVASMILPSLQVPTRDMVRIADEQLYTMLMSWSTLMPSPHSPESAQSVMLSTESSNLGDLLKMQLIANGYSPRHLNDLSIERNLSEHDASNLLNQDVCAAALIDSIKHMRAFISLNAVRVLSSLLTHTDLNSTPPLPSIRDPSMIDAQQAAKTLDIIFHKTQRTIPRVLVPSSGPSVQNQINSSEHYHTSEANVLQKFSPVPNSYEKRKNTAEESTNLFSSPHPLPVEKEDFELPTISNKNLSIFKPSASVLQHSGNNAIEEANLTRRSSAPHFGFVAPTSTSFIIPSKHLKNKLAIPVSSSLTNLKQALSVLPTLSSYNLQFNPSSSSPEYYHQVVSSGRIMKGSTTFPSSQLTPNSAIKDDTILHTSSAFEQLNVKTSSRFPQDQMNRRSSLPVISSSPMGPSKQLPLLRAKVQQLSSNKRKNLSKNVYSENNNSPNFDNHDTQQLATFYNHYFSHHDNNSQHNEDMTDIRSKKTEGSPGQLNKASYGLRHKMSGSFEPNLHPALVGKSWQPLSVNRDDNRNLNQQALAATDEYIDDVTRTNSYKITDKNVNDDSYTNHFASAAADAFLSPSLPLENKKSPATNLVSKNGTKVKGGGFAMGVDHNHSSSNSTLCDLCNPSTTNNNEMVSSVFNSNSKKTTFNSIGPSLMPGIIYANSSEIENYFEQQAQQKSINQFIKKNIEKSDNTSSKQQDPFPSSNSVDSIILAAQGLIRPIDSPTLTAAEKQHLIEPRSTSSPRKSNHNHSNEKPPVDGVLSNASIIKMAANVVSHELRSISLIEKSYQRPTTNAGQSEASLQTGRIRNNEEGVQADSGDMPNETSGRNEHVHHSLSPFDRVSSTARSLGLQFSPKVNNSSISPHAVQPSSPQSLKQSSEPFTKPSPPTSLASKPQTVTMIKSPSLSGSARHDVPILPLDDVIQSTSVHNQQPKRVDHSDTLFDSESSLLSSSANEHLHKTEEIKSHVTQTRFKTKTESKSHKMSANDSQNLFSSLNNDPNDNLQSPLPPNKVRSGASIHFSPISPSYDASISANLQLNQSSQSFHTSPSRFGLIPSRVHKFLPGTSLIALRDRAKVKQVLDRAPDALVSPKTATRVQFKSPRGSARPYTEEDDQTRSAVMMSASLLQMNRVIENRSDVVTALRDNHLNPHGERLGGDLIGPSSMLSGLKTNEKESIITSASGVRSAFKEEDHST